MISQIIIQVNQITHYNHKFNSPYRTKTGSLHINKLEI
jgi:hypothetical protein